jgi:hypothetical protein
METRDPHHWQRREVDAAIEQLAKFRDGCATAERQWGRSARVWGNTNLILGLSAALVSAVAGASVLGELVRTSIIAALALTAAALSAVNAALRPADKLDQARTQRTAYQTLRLQADTYLEIDIQVPRRRLQAPSLYRDFAERRLAVLARKPLPEMWAKGRPEGPAYDDDELAWLIE